jgi:hypothetical protein
MLCRTYRSNLEEAGFTWAPERLAHQFSYEGCGPNPRPMLESHFGYHGAFNFRQVFGMEALKQRAELMLADDYVRDSYMMQGFAQMNPNVMTELVEQVGGPAEQQGVMNDA